MASTPRASRVVSGAIMRGSYTAPPTSRRTRTPFPEMMNHPRALAPTPPLALSACAAPAPGPSWPADRPVPPEVFELVECWLSDTEQPVVTEISLAAVARNRNQFQAGSIRREG